MMLPILISVSVAPSSYFFCASAPVLDPAKSANAATDTIAVLFRQTVMTFSLSSNVSDGCVWHGFLGRKLLMLRDCVSFYRVAHKKKPSARGAKGCFFSRLSRRSAIPQSGIPVVRSVAELAAQDLAEQVPLLALEAHHLQLLDRGEVGRR